MNGAGMLRPVVLALALCLAALPLRAVQPDEILSDPALEARARAISQVLRCPVCQGETIDESNAPISRDLRLAVRERLVAGDSDAEVIDYITGRFGEFVLFQPRATGANILLWIAGPSLLLVALGGALLYLRRRSAAPEPEARALTEDERARLDEILRQ
jgi:cytochrome c-type biogenesis protein CcmH